MPSNPELLRVARQIHQHLQRRQTLPSLAQGVGQSPFTLQRAFRRLTGESPATYARRLRLMQVVTELLGGKAPLRAIARRAGFAGTEVLIRNFRRGFGCTPEQYRRRHGVRQRDALFRRGLAQANHVARCLTLYHLPLNLKRRLHAMPMLATELRQLESRPVMMIRSRIARSEIAATIGQSLGRIVPHVLGAGGTLAGQPYARYPDFSAGMLTIEVGMPVGAPVAGEGDIESTTLPGGLTAVALHGGAYERLHETFAAFERWIASQGRTPNGAPWELYVNDPADFPDPEDWRTEIYWPVR